MNSFLYIVVWLQIAWELFLIKYEDCICTIAQAILIGAVTIAAVVILSIISV